MPGRACLIEKKEKNTGLKESSVLSLSYGEIVVKPPEKLFGLVPSSFETYQIVNPDYVVVRPIDLQNDKNSLRFGFSRYRGIITSAYICFESTEYLKPDYTHLLLHSYDLMKVFYGLGSGLRQNLDLEDFKRLPLLVPSIPEQFAIVRFLDHATSQIEHYILVKEKMIALLEEQKKAIIHNAVTGRIDVRTGKPYSAYKPSGVEWLGEVPEHWEVRRLRNVGKALIGITYSPDDVVDRGEGLLVLRASNIRGAKIVDADNVYVRCQVPGRLLTLEGDILLCSRSGSRTLVGKNAVIDARCAGVTFGAFMTVFRSASNEFLRFAFNSALFERQSGAFQTSTINQLTLSMLYSIRAPFPPPGEQSIIVRYLNDAIAKTIRASDRTNHEIKLLRKYRTRLIADVVTGKLDVREAAKALPDISPSVPSDQIEMFQASS